MLSTLQAATLLLFNEVEELSYSEVQERLNLQVLCIMFDSIVSWMLWCVNQSLWACGNASCVGIECGCIRCCADVQLRLCLQALTMLDGDCQLL